VIEPNVTGKEAGSALHRSRAGEDDFMIVLSHGSRQQTYLPPANVVPHTIALSTHHDLDGEYVRGELQLRADEGLIICVTFTLADAQAASLLPVGRLSGDVIVSEQVGLTPRVGGTAAANAQRRAAVAFAAPAGAASAPARQRARQ
jgi:hypothetical protein